jgi:cobalt-precorrin 5A hydrolase
MRIAYVSLTDGGAVLAQKASALVKGDVYSKHSYEGSEGCMASDFSTFVGKLFAAYDAIIFIMAAGIVVRTIAPFIRSKETDPAIVVMDEKGRFAVSLLSGHIGGANELCKSLSESVGSVPVITTATDVNGVVSFDMVAVRNGCRIENIGMLKYVSSSLVNGETIGLYSDLRLEVDSGGNIDVSGSGIYGSNVVVSSDTGFEKPGNTLYLRPKDIVLGIGCRRGTRLEVLEASILKLLGENGRLVDSISKVVSIDLKKDEEAILSFCEKYSVTFETISAEEIRAVEHMFESSDFVKSKVGVSSVSESCAYIGSKKGAMLTGKVKFPGITLALAKEDKVIII